MTLSPGNERVPHSWKTNAFSSLPLCFLSFKCCFTIYLLGIEGAFYEAGSKTVIPKKVSASCVHNILTTVMTNIFVDKSTDNAEPLSVC